MIPRRRSPVRLVLLIGVPLLALPLAVGHLLGGHHAADPVARQAPGVTSIEQVRFASPAGTGTSCSRSQPCTAETGVNSAEGATEVRLLGGRYPQLLLKRPATARSTTVTVRPQAGTRAFVLGIDAGVPGLRLQGLNIGAGGVYVRPTAVGAVLDQLVVDGGGAAVANVPAVTLAADGSRLTRSRLLGRVDGDLVFVGKGGVGAHVDDVVIADNTIGPAAVGAKGAHVDCVQIATEASAIRILRNRMFGCSNSALIIKADHGPVRDVLVEDNFLQGCLSRTAACAGYFAVYIRKNLATNDPLIDIDFRHNTVDGDLSIDPAPSVSVVANVIAGRLFPGQERCGPWLRGNLIAVTGCRRTLPAGNMVGMPRFVDRSKADLHLASGSTVLRSRMDQDTAPDIDGDARPSTSAAGADEPAG